MPRPRFPKKLVKSSTCAMSSTCGPITIPRSSSSTTTGSASRGSRKVTVTPATAAKRTITKKEVESTPSTPAPGLRPVRRDVAAALAAEPRAEADQRGMRRDLARDERLTLREACRALDETGRHEREHLADVGQIGRGVHPHEHEIVALRDNVLVNLLRALGDDDQVEPELAPLPRDPDRVGRRERGERILRCGGADVVGLVDDDGHGLALGPSAPEALEHRPRDERLLLARSQRAEVDDQAARAVGPKLVDDRGAGLPGPHGPAVHAEVAGSQLERVGARALEVGEAADAPVLDEPDQLGVLLPVADRVELEHGRLVGGAQLAEAHAEAGS